MPALLDTNAFLWFISGSDRLSENGGSGDSISNSMLSPDHKYLSIIIYVPGIPEPVFYVRCQ
jgi:PIN domain nuclease of toxin-antitoxin system